MSLLYLTSAPLSNSDWNLTQCLELLQLFCGHERANLRQKVHPLRMAEQRNGTTLDPLAGNPGSQWPRQPGRPMSRLALQLERAVSCGLNSLSIGFPLTAVSRHSHICTQGDLH